MQLFRKKRTLLLIYYRTETEIGFRSILFKTKASSDNIHQTIKNLTEEEGTPIITNVQIIIE